MLRNRMRHILRLLENNCFDDVKSEICTPENLKAIRALTDLGCVEAFYSLTDELVELRLTDHSFTYQLERSDVWLNRIYGFIAGIITSVVAGLLLRAML